MSEAAQRARRRVALLGGSFNPPHVGHLLAAVYVKSVFADDEVWLVPAYQHPFGKPLAAWEDRLEMCRLLAADAGPWLSVCEAEAQVGGEGRTVELLEYLVARHGEVRFRFVIGSDILADLPKWKAWDRIQQLSDVTVLHRAGFPSALAVGPPLLEVSSRQIRAHLRDPHQLQGLLPASVARHIRERRLYRDAAEEP